MACQPDRLKRMRANLLAIEEDQQALAATREAAQ